MSARAVGITFFSGIWLAVQVAVPIAGLRGRLEDDRIRPFGWQMFSGFSPCEVYLVVGATGAFRLARVQDHAYVVRIDVPYMRSFPRYLCGVEPDAQGVVRLTKERSHYHPCR